MIPIVYEDDDLLVIEKPNSMLVHATDRREPDTVVEQLRDHLKKVWDESNRSGIVHRLDRPASGLLVVAKTREALHALQQEFKAHAVKKEYVALVHGRIAREEGTITLSIEHSQRGGRMAAKPKGIGKESATEFFVTGRSARYTLLLVRTLTGRTHQIRAHFFALGHPLVGDLLYCNKKWKDDAPRLFLHCTTLGFHHPTTGEYKEFHSELPEELKHYLHDKRIGSRE